MVKNFHIFYPTLQNFLAKAPEILYYQHCTRCPDEGGSVQNTFFGGKRDEGEEERYDVDLKGYGKPFLGGDSCIREKKKKRKVGVV
jgi:hypothetical protein